MVDAADSTNPVTLIGSQQGDVLTAGGNPGHTPKTANTLLGNGGDDTLVSGGAGLNLLVGGAGGDMLTGGNVDGSNNGVDRFVYNAASESQLSFKKGEDDDGNTIYTAEGYDTIENFDSGINVNGTIDTLHFSKALHAIVTAGEVVAEVDVANGIKSGDDDWDGLDGRSMMMAIREVIRLQLSVLMATGQAVLLMTGSDNGSTSDGGATDLRSFIGNGKGLFLTSLTVTDGPFGSDHDLQEQHRDVNDDYTSGKEAPGCCSISMAMETSVTEDDMVIFLWGCSFAPQPLTSRCSSH